MEPNLNRDINYFAENFYADALEREILFNEIFQTIKKDDGLKSVQHTNISKSKLLSLALFSFETILKSLYILSNCHSYDEEIVGKTYRKLFSFGHNIEKIYKKLPKERKNLSDEEYEILKRYSKNGVSIRYNMDAYYNYNIYDKIHSGDSYIRKKDEIDIIRKNKLKKTQEGYEKKLRDLKIEYKQAKLNEIDKSLKMFEKIFSKLKSLYREKGLRKFVLEELISNGEIENIDDLGPYDELVNGISLVSIPLKTHLVLQKVIDKKPKHAKECCFMQCLKDLFNNIKVFFIKKISVNS